jgi:hypothetical protein
MQCWDSQFQIKLLYKFYYIKNGNITIAATFKKPKISLEAI